MLVNVKNSPPTACFNVSPSEGIVGKTEFTFDASCSSDPEGSILSYEWNFGDGSTATGAIAKHIYKTSVATDQIFYVQLVVTDSAGDKDDEIKPVKVKNSAPLAKFSAVPIAGLKPLTVVFVAHASDPDGHEITRYYWDFGDGTTFDGGPEYIKVYTTESTTPYHATLKVYDEYGGESPVYHMEIAVYAQKGIETLRASNTVVGGSTTIYVGCTEATSASTNINLTLKHSDGTLLTTISIQCNQSMSYGPIKTPGIYTVIAQAPDCAANVAECTKTTTFHVFEEMPEVKTPEISFLLVVAVAFIALGMAKLKNKNS